LSSTQHVVRSGLEEVSPAAPASPSQRHRGIYQGAKFLSTALVKNKTLTALYLNYNNIGDLGLEHLLGALKDNTCAAVHSCPSSRHTWHITRCEPTDRLTAPDWPNG
jgi:hypothetical protein